MYRRNPISSLFYPDPAAPAAGGAASAAGGAASAAGGAASAAGGAAPAAAAPAAAAPAAATPAAAAPAATSVLGAAGVEVPAAPAAAPAAAVVVSAADQRKYLAENTEDGKTDAGKATLAAKTDVEVGKLYDAAKKLEADKLIADATPEAYAKNLKLPDGLTLDKDIADGFFKLAAKGKATQAEVQAVVDVYTAKAKEAAQAPYRIWEKTQSDWRKEIETDKEIGGEHLKANLAFAAKFINSLPNAAEVRKALDFTGAGNNPAITRAFIAAGKIVAEGGAVLGGPGKGTARSAAEVFYPAGAAGVAAGKTP